MTIMLKIMQSGFDYDRKRAEQQRDLYYAKFSNIPSIQVGGMSFYEINDLLSIPELSATKQSKLSKLKLGDSMQLFRVGRDRYYHAVRLNSNEETVLKNLQKEQDELTKINQEIENQVGHLLKTKKAHEKNIDSLKAVFK